jgi:hypothetical protein
MGAKIGIGVGVGVGALVVILAVVLIIWKTSSSGRQVNAVKPMSA